MRHLHALIAVGIVAVACSSKSTDKDPQPVPGGTGGSVSAGGAGGAPGGAAGAPGGAAGTPTGLTCLCSDGGVVLTPTNCSWGDGDKCTGLASAYCYVKCGGFPDPCFADCDGTFPQTQIADVSSYVVPDPNGCTIAITCPVP